MRMTIASLSPCTIPIELYPRPRHTLSHPFPLQTHRAAHPLPRFHTTILQWSSLSIARVMRTLSITDHPSAHVLRPFYSALRDALSNSPSLLSLWIPTSTQAGSSLHACATSHTPVYTRSRLPSHLMFTALAPPPVGGSRSTTREIVADVSSHSVYGSMHGTNGVYTQPGRQKIFRLLDFLAIDRQRARERR